MTIYFQVQLLKLKCTDNTKKHKNTSAFKSDRSKKASSLKKIKGQRKRYKELKRDIIEIQSQEESIEKGNRKRKRIYKKINIRKILDQKENMEKKKNAENIP